MCNLNRNINAINTKAMSPQSKNGGDLEVVLEVEKTSNGVDLKLSNASATSGTTSYYTSQPKRSSFLKHPLTFSQRIREYRHNRCIMAPLAYTVIIALIVTAFVGLLLALPQFLLGILLAPLLRRQKWIVQFLYQNSVARWGHINIMKFAGKKSQNNGAAAKSEELPGHSQTINQRITVVPGRVYIHPIPQFIDNISYLIVSCPPREAVGKLPILGVLVDCGEDAKVKAHLEGIYKKYYACFYTRNKEIKGIELHAILCTHRHHDHTAGVGALVKELSTKRRGESKGKKPILVNAGRSGGDGQPKLYEEAPGNVIVVGGAVEQVPHCTLYVKNGCFVPLPCLSLTDGDATLENDMNAILSIEVIGVPSHTRGSVVFALRNRPAPNILTLTAVVGGKDTYSQTHLFTGDAIFTGGAGAPFEADLERSRDNFLKNPKKLNSKNGSTPIRPQAGSLSTERCFAEVLIRASDSYSSGSSLVSSRQTTLLYPGHEYTTDLLMRQFDQTTITYDGHWVRMAPSIFFETASHYFMSAHRRALSQGQKLLTAPTPLHKEMIVNPNFRTLKRRAEHLVNALLLWYEFGAKNRVPASKKLMFTPTNPRRKDSVFTTIYSDDLNTILQALRSGKIDPVSAADQIEALESRLDENLIARRPIPSTLPSHKNVYLGILAITILGSAPAAVTLSDANIMNMAAPVDSTDEILISKSRLISALREFDLLSGGETVRLEDIIALLWDEARLDNKSKEEASTTDVESSIDNDFIELGLLKLSMFGVAMNQPTWFSKYCAPCRQPQPEYDESSWVTTCKLKRSKGELQRHDPKTCLLCQGVVSP